jgi:hypothetical protein
MKYILKIYTLLIFLNCIPINSVASIADNLPAKCLLVAGASHSSGYKSNYINNVMAIAATCHYEGCTSVTYCRNLGYGSSVTCSSNGYCCQ